MTSTDANAIGRKSLVLTVTVRGPGRRIVAPSLGDAPDRFTPAPVPEFNRTEQVARYGGNWLVHLGLNQGPTLWAMAAHLLPLPGVALFASDVFNVATTVPALVLDAREIRGVLKNPLATRMDKAMDLVHLGGDVLSLAGAVVPLCVSLTSPLWAGIFFGTQLLSIGLDVGKTVYDAHRKGQQSAYVEARQAAAQHQSLLEQLSSQRTVASPTAKPQLA